MGRIKIPGQSRQKSSRDTISMEKKKLGMVAFACHPSISVKSKIQGLQSRLTWTKSKTLSPK
jgi:hypothetical protein